MSEVTNSYGRCKPGLRFFVQDYPRISSHRPHNRVYTEKTLIQTLACQLSLTLMQLLFSFCKDMRVNKKYKLSLVNSHQPLCNSCSRLTTT